MFEKRQSANDLALASTPKVTEFTVHLSRGYDHVVRGYNSRKVPKKVLKKTMHWDCNMVLFCLYIRIGNQEKLGLLMKDIEICAR